MADNYYKNDQIIYGMDINEDTVWSSHDADGNLISQRTKKTRTVTLPGGGTQLLYYDYTYDIPCYPTGLFLQIKFSLAFLDQNLKIDYYPSSGNIRCYQEDNTEISILGTYYWGSCVPKTYCANNRTIFGYHDFSQKKLSNDLQAKWYAHKNEVIINSSFSVSQPIIELKDVTQLIFMDPNLWSFQERTVSGNQTAGEVDRFPLYKQIDDNSGETNSSLHSNLYLLNFSELEGKYDFLYLNGRNYTFTTENKTYNSFNYGYMSNEDSNKKAIGNRPVVVFDNTPNKANWTPKTHEIARYGIGGAAIRAMIEDAPFAYDMTKRTEWLMEGTTNLLYYSTAYSKNNPYVFFDSANTKESKGSSGFLDQFHFLIEDKIIRVPLKWRVEKSIKAMEITSVKLLNNQEETFNWNYLFPAISATSVAPADASILKIDTTPRRKAIYSLKPQLSTQTTWKTQTFEHKLNTTANLSLPGGYRQMLTNNRKKPFEIFNNLTIRFKTSGLEWRCSPFQKTKTAQTEWSQTLDLDFQNPRDYKSLQRYHTYEGLSAKAFYYYSLQTTTGGAGWELTDYQELYYLFLGIEQPGYYITADKLKWEIEGTNRSSTNAFVDSAEIAGGKLKSINYSSSGTQYTIQDRSLINNNTTLFENIYPSINPENHQREFINDKNIRVTIPYNSIPLYPWYLIGRSGDVNGNFAMRVNGNIANPYNDTPTGNNAVKTADAYVQFFNTRGLTEYRDEVLIFGWPDHLEGDPTIVKESFTWSYTNNSTIYYLCKSGNITERLRNELLKILKNDLGFTSAAEEIVEDWEWMFESFSDDDINLTNYKYQDLSFSTDQINTLKTALQEHPYNKSGNSCILEVVGESFVEGEEEETKNIVIFITAHMSDIPSSYRLSMDNIQYTIEPPSDESNTDFELSIESECEKNGKWVVQFRIGFNYKPADFSSVQINCDVIGENINEN